RQRLRAPLVGTDVERHAVAQLPGVSDLVGAVGAGIALVLSLVQRLERVVARGAGRVGERLGVAEREARPLDEGAGRVDRDRALILVVDVDRRVGAQSAVRRLRAAIEVDVRTVPRRVRADRAVLCAARAGVLRRAGTGDVPAVVGTDVATDLQTN